MTIRKIGRPSFIASLWLNNVAHLEHKSSKPREKKQHRRAASVHFLHSVEANKEKCWITMITRALKIAYHLPIWMEGPCRAAKWQQEQWPWGQNLWSVCFVVSLTKWSSYSKWPLQTGPRGFLSTEKKNRGVPPNNHTHKMWKKGKMEPTIIRRIRRDTQPI